MKEKVICGIQQVGIGVHNMGEVWQWYRDVFGFSTKIFEDEGVAERMLPYTAGKPQPRIAMLAMNLRGGGGFEIWEPRGRKLNYPENAPVLGDTGIFACKVKAPDVWAVYNQLSDGSVKLLTRPGQSPWDQLHFFLLDPWNNLIQVEEDNYLFLDDKKKLTGGVNGVILGVSDMEKSIKFYSKLLDYDTVYSDSVGVFEDFNGIEGGHLNIRRVLLKRSKELQGPMCELMGTSHLELVQVMDSSAKPQKIYEGRLWGDPGYIHLCFDVRNMEAVRADALSLGHDFVCDSGDGFDMGDANGHFTYVEDPDGTLIEFVETFKVPILKKLGIYLHLRNKDDRKPLPRVITKALKLL